MGVSGGAGGWRGPNKPASGETAGCWESESRGGSPGGGGTETRPSLHESGRAQCRQPADEGLLGKAEEGDSEEDSRRESEIASEGPRAGRGLDR